MPVAAVIPAYNEALTVGGVVATARAAERVDEVLVVVDDGSTDNTAEVAAAAGARVVHIRGRGKGEAMAGGVAATDADVIVFLDADLIGLRPDHVDRLVAAVVDEGAGMACGLFDRGWMNAAFLHVLPVLTGERAVRRELFASLGPDDIRGYKIEAALNARAAEAGLPVVSFVCDGMWHRTKEEKFASPVEGYVRKVGMLSVAMWSYVSYWGRRRLASRLHRS